MKKVFLFLSAMAFLSAGLFAQQKFSGIDANLSNLYRLSEAKSRSISPENFTGAKGEGGERCFKGESCSTGGGI